MFSTSMDRQACVWLGRVLLRQWQGSSLTKVAVDDRVSVGWTDTRSLRRHPYPARIRRWQTLGHTRFTVLGDGDFLKSKGLNTWFAVSLILVGIGLAKALRAVARARRSLGDACNRPIQLAVAASQAEYLNNLKGATPRPARLE